MNSRKDGIFWNFWFPLFLAILIYCAADVLLKRGNIEIRGTLSSLFQGEIWLEFILNLTIITAFVLSLISKLIMGYILSKNPLGFSQGLFLGISAFLLFLFGIIFFNETLTFWKAVAICAITIGIFLLHSSGNSTNSSMKKELYNHNKQQIEN